MNSGPLSRPGVFMPSLTCLSPVTGSITVMDSSERHLSNQRLFNVGVTRVRDELIMIVDDKARLERQLDRTTGDKTSALETVGLIEIDRPIAGARALPERLRSAAKMPEQDRVGPAGGGEEDGLKMPEGRPALPPLPERGLGLGL